MDHLLLLIIVSLAVFGILMVYNSSVALQFVNASLGQEYYFSRMRLVLGCASFGMFSNYKERGTLFKLYAQKITG